MWRWREPRRSSPSGAMWNTALWSTSTETGLSSEAFSPFVNLKAPPHQYWRTPWCGCWLPTLLGNCQGTFQGVSKIHFYTLCRNFCWNRYHSRLCILKEKKKWEIIFHYLHSAIVGPVLYTYNAGMCDFCVKQTFRLQNYLAQLN